VLSHNYNSSVCSNVCLIITTDFSKVFRAGLYQSNTISWIYDVLEMPFERRQFSYSFQQQVQFGETRLDEIN